MLQCWNNVVNIRINVAIIVSCNITFSIARFYFLFICILTGALLLTLAKFIYFHIAQSAYCSSDIYFQFNKARRSVILRAIMQRFYESALRWPEPIYMRVGYVFDLRFSE